MSYLIASPDALAAAAKDLNGIGSALSEAHAAAFAPTTQVLAAAQDEVSAAIAAGAATAATLLHIYIRLMPPPGPAGPAVQARAARAPTGTPAPPGRHNETSG